MSAEVETKCGTYAGWNAHRYYGTEVCDLCCKARSAYMREWRGKTTVDWRRADAARKRALSALANLHPDDFQRLYVEEMRKSAKPRTRRKAGATS